MNQYGRVIHVVGPYAPAEAAERSAHDYLRQDYLAALQAGLVPAQGQFTLVAGPVVPVAGSPDNRQRHYMAWQVTSATLIADSPFYRPEGFAFSLSPDSGVFTFP